MQRRVHISELRASLPHCAQGLVARPSRWPSANEGAAAAATRAPVLLPTEAQEIAAPNDADHAYRSATRRLIELRRGKTFQMVEDENASYGFRRNLFGLKAVAIAVAGLSAIATGLVWLAELPKPINIEGLERSITTYPYLPALLLSDLAYMLMFVLLIGREFVRQAADDRRNIAIRARLKRLTVGMAYASA